MIYPKKFYERQRTDSKKSADIVLDALVHDVLGEIREIKSVIDLGCGVGTWLSFFHERGGHVLGVDGDYVNRDLLLIPRDSFIPMDLTSDGLERLEGRFDLAMSLEVAEHLPDSASDSFIKKLCGLSDIVLFSAAIPFQRGKNHINCQWQSYWREKFSCNGFTGVDAIRKLIWSNDSVSSFYRQNIMLYVRNDTDVCRSLKKDTDFIADIVHPVTYLEDVRHVF